MKYLIDCCIWRDFYEARSGRNGKPFASYASDLFIKLIKSKSTILFSDTLIIELKQAYSSVEINDLLGLLFTNEILIKIKTNEYEFKEAKKLSKEREIPFADCLNAIQARNHNATVVTNDSHYFKSLSDIATAKRPEEIN